MIKQEELEELGFNKVVSNIESKINEAKEDREVKLKVTLAYELYRVVTPDKIQRFDEELKKRTLFNNTGGWATYDKLRFTSISIYDSIPPQQALDNLRIAQERHIFDRFEVCDIESHTEVPDPIIFGSIDGCADRFFIAQWDDDVKIEDILRENEG